MNNCIFCQIVEGEVPAKKVFESEEILAFWDINPVAPIDILIIPKKHIGNLFDAKEEDLIALGYLLMAAKEVAISHGLLNSGFRLVINNGKDADQIIPHLHAHVLGGKNLGSKIIA
ncbi:histidine triad nucleotide-binding protein [bacterium CG2_30_37_16]|nr:MAG: histidine triad nucleotide-binding protein [bacterium CG2_30_37_16]PIX98936.1 MAG: histidine triad nucleotide-binding protein [bacterium (Candidatus Howlettbacteria) CG_4_10_14_3_um_filter_37_10]